ncbi:nucleolar protein 6 [Anopheles stephensi]|uniref:nucleolar protein 6 n=1 Tax=Anopheles stephensi TaxID=30069 RepID=UPI0016589B05|nr:nucleolar protein 6 [Anopheles stephensi]
MNRVKKKSAGSLVLLKKKKVKKQPVPVESDNDSYDSMVDNGTEEEDDDGDVSTAGDGNDSMDSGLESGALVRVAKPPKKSASKAIKRKVAAHNDEEMHRKRVKEMKALYKPPTVEEINRLKETENYYHSNLFRMQSEEMLKEVRVPTKLGRFVQVWLEQFKGFLQTIESESNARSLLELDYDGFEFPLQLKTTGSQYMQEVLGKERFRFLQQRHVRTFGGCDTMLRTSFGKPLVVDLLLIMPEKCLHKEDYLNLRYHYKRAHYLCTIAQQLLQQSAREEKIASTVRFEPLKGDRLKPVLVIIPADETFAKKVHFKLHAVADATSFPKKRFLPHRNNVRPSMIGQGVEPDSTEEYENFPTPHYNTSILYDVRLAKNAELLESIIQSESIREAIILLKVWIRQRHFDRGRYPFDGAIVTFYIAYLLQNKRIYPNMSSYQIIRLFWNQLAGSNWEKEGITFDNSSRETLKSFFRYYDVVFIDPLGMLNLTANLPVDLYRRVRHESALAIRLLDNPKVNSFLPLFLANYPAFTQYDHIITVQGSKLIAATVDSFAEDVDKLDYLGDVQALLTRMVERLLRKGLGTRASYLVPLDVNHHPNESAMTADPRLVLGLSLNGTNAFNLVDKGPEAIDTAASEAFRAFWQGKAELRRFKDGSITESCVWGEATDPIGQKRLIVRSIVQFLLQAHLDIPDSNVRYLANQFELAIAPFPKQKLHQTIEERSLAVIRAFDTVGRMMRDLEKLPLTIHAILGTDPVFRYTDPDPPRPTASGVLVGGRLVFLSAKPIHATIQLEASGKWPADLEAIRRLKTAFYLRIADSITKTAANSSNKPLAQAYNEYLDVLYENFLFRFVIIHQREITILREYLADNKVTRLQQDTDESIALEMQATILPKLTGFLHGLHQQYFSFGSVAAIAKRWLYSQLIDTYLWPDECTELLLAAIYLNQPLQPPIQPQTGFLRWLQFVASTDWSKEMIVVNLNDELSSETIEQVEKEFYERRQNFPPLTIVTPADEGKYGLFGRRAPTVEILNRVTLLAQAATKLIDTNYRTLQKIQNFFEPSLEGYNLIIHLDSTIVTPIGIPKPKEMAMQSAASLYAKSSNTDPAAGFSPVRFYLQELRAAYRQFAIFFYDPCGGDRIAVLWRPQALEEKPFSTSNVNGRKVTEHGALQLNVDALVRDFELLGHRLVSRIERRF